MKEDRLIKKVEGQANRFKQRALKGPSDRKRHDQIQRDEQQWMWTAHKQKQLGWSFAKIGSVFNRDQRTVKKAVESYEAEQEQGQIYREGTVTTVAGQGGLFDIELLTRQAILHQLRIIGSRTSVFMVMVSERANNYVDAMHSNIGIFQSHGRVVQETFRLPDWYYEDKDGGTHLHLEITPLTDQYLKPQTPVEFRVGVWFTSISR